jgi:REP element-mobilizing transposase RayT
MFWMGDAGAMQGAMQGATQVSPVRGLIEERLRITAEKFPFMKWEEAVIMPDHLHALIRLQGGHARLGDVIGGFKAAVSREIRRMGETGVAPPKHIRIWHRNYYEMIVRTSKAERHIREYIRANPWKLVQHGAHEGQSYRMIGNPALLNREKTGMLCSRNCPPDVLAAARHRAYEAGEDCCFVSGFHSPPEKAILQSLLGGEARIICCPAWGIDTMKIPGDWLAPLDANRMLILEMRNRGGSVAAAEQRNRFVINFADKLCIPHVSRGGMLERLLGPVTSRSLPRLSSLLPANACR